MYHYWSGMPFNIYHYLSHALASSSNAQSEHMENCPEWGQRRCQINKGRPVAKGVFRLKTHSWRRYSSNLPLVKIKTPFQNKLM